MIIKLCMIVAIIACSLQLNVNGFYMGDQDTYAQMMSAFGAKQFSSINTSNFIITGDEDGITGKAASGKTLRVLQLLDQLVPDFVRHMEDVSSNFKTDKQHPFNFLLDNFTVSTDTNELAIGTGSYDSIEIVPSFLTLKDLTVIIKIAIDSEATTMSERFQFRGLAVAGVWRLRRAGGLDFKVSKYGSQWYFYGAPESGDLDVGKFAQDIATTVLPAGDLRDSLKKSGLDEVRINDAHFVGAMNEEGFAIGLTGSLAIEGWGNFNGRVLVHRYVDTPWQTKRTVVTIAINFPSYRFASLVNKLTGMDISSIPLLGSLTVPEMGLVVSSGTVDPNLLLVLMDGIMAHANPILKGVVIVLKIPIVKNQPAVQFIVRVNSNDIRFTIIDPGASLTLRNLLNAVSPGSGLSDISIPGLSDLLNLQLYGFEYQHKSKSIAVELQAGDKIEVIPKLMSVLNPTVSLSVTLKKPSQKTIAVTGSFKMGSKVLPVELVPASTSSKSQRQFQLTASFDDINIADIIKQFRVDFLPSQMQTVLKKARLLDFPIQDPFISVPIATGSSGFQMQVSGSPRIGDWSGVTLNALLSKNSGKIALTMGLEFGNIGFAGLIQKLTGANVRSISLLEKSMKCAIVISPRTMDGVSLQGDILSTVPIERGLSVVGLLRFPSNCQRDKICDFCKKAFGSNTEIRLRAVIQSPGQFLVAAGVPNVKLSNTLEMTSVELQLKVGKETSFGLEGSLKLSNPPLTFKGAIRFKPPKLQLEMSMNGIWKRAFGNNYLAVKNLQLEIGVTLVFPPTISMLKFGGEVRVGKVDSGKEMIAKAYIGIDINSPRDNYFYGSISKASIRGILDAFDMKANLPQVLAKSGFDKGLSSSYSIKPVKVPGMTIPAGLRMKGNMNILGFTISTDIELNPPTRILINARLGKLDLGGGALKLCASRTNCRSGPLFYAKIQTTPPSVNVRIKGYARLFGFLERDIEIYVTNKEYIFTITNRLFLFDAKMRVYATYGSLRSTKFRVNGELSTAYLTSIRKKVMSVIKSGADQATSKISDAQKEVDGAQKAYDNAVKKLKDSKKEVDKAKGAYDKAVKKLKKAQSDVKKLCKIKKCSKWCIGCPYWKKCCYKVWGSCVGCPKTKSCCTKITDPACATSNLLCKGLRKTAFAALWAAEKFIDKNRWPLDAAKAALDAAADIVDKNRSPLTAAKDFLEGVKSAVKVGAKAASEITKLTLGGLINIRKITFDVQIGLVQSGHFRGTIEVSFLKGSFKKMSFDLQLKSVAGMANDLANEIFPGITSRSRRSVEEQISRALPDFSRKYYFPEESIYTSGTAKRDAPNDIVKTAAELLREFAEESGDGLVDNVGETNIETTEKEATSQDEEIVEIIEEKEDEGPDPLDELDEYIPLADDAKEAEEEAEQLIHLGDSENYLPSDDEALDIDKEKFDLKKVEKRSESREGTCVQVEELAAIFVVLKSIGDDWRNSTREYKKTKTAFCIDCLQLSEFKSQALEQQVDIRRTLKILVNHGKPGLINEQDLMAVKKNLTQEEQEFTAVEKLSQGFKKYLSNTRNRLVEQNRKGVRLLLSKVIDPIVKRQTNMESRMYFSKLPDSLTKSHQEEQLETAKAQRAISKIEDLRSAIDDLFSPYTTLFQLLVKTNRILVDLDEIKNQTSICE